jgi:Glycosyl transferase family 11
MIVMKIHGGLGNQMFQYALGRHLALRLKTVLKLDVSFYQKESKRHTTRNFQLDVFKTDVTFATEKDLKQILGMSFLREPNRLLNRFGINILSHYYSEKTHNFNSEVLNLKDNAYLEGYWQTPQYFDEIEDIIRTDFVFKETVNASNASLAHQIEPTESVAIHIRRGDYLNNPRHNVFDISYIEKGIAFMQDSLGDKIRLFIFSDDLPWCRENLNMLYPNIPRSYCDGGNGKEDFQLMSMCKHFIIANSSFSWWAAYLSTNSDKIVIAPKKWFNDERINSSDLIPQNWIQI